MSDVTALANSDGGDLVIGIRAEKGVARELVGLQNFAPDDRLNQIENLLRDCVQPRVSGVRLLPVPLASGGHALVIRVPRSFAAPHMVRHLGITRFCGRNSNGKYDLDIHEIRSAFLAGEGLSDRLRRFRFDRINKLVSGVTPIPLTSRHFLVLHLLPVLGARPDHRIATSVLRDLKNEQLLRTITPSSSGSTFNIDGLIVNARWVARAYYGYAQLFRNGYLEAVDSQSLNPRTKTKFLIPNIGFEKYILQAFPSYSRLMSRLEIPPPYVVSLSLLNVRNYSMYVGPAYDNSEAHPVDRDHLLTDEVLIESADAQPDVLLRPLFDQIWNGCGWPQSINYGVDGRWRERS